MKLGTGFLIRTSRTMRGIKWLACLACGFALVSATPFFNRSNAFAQDHEGGAAVAVAQPAPPGFDHALALATFDKVWTLIQDTHFDPEYNGVDWDAAREEFRPRVQEANSTGELREVLQEMISRLGQSHFAIIPGEAARTLTSGNQGADDSSSPRETDEADTDADGPASTPSKSRAGDSAKPRNIDRAGGDHGGPGVTGPPGQANIPDDAAAKSKAKSNKAGRSKNDRAAPSNDDSEEGDLGIDVRLINDDVVVFLVEPGSSADQAGVKPGWIIESLYDREVSETVEDFADALDELLMPIYVWQALQAQLTGPVGTIVPMTFVDANGETVELELTRAPSAGEVIKFGNLPPMRVTFNSDTRDLGDRDDRFTIGIIRFNFWMPNVTARFGRAYKELEDADAIVLDLRGNLGGVGGMVMGIGGYFTDESQSLGTLKTREAELKFTTIPQYSTPAGQPIKPFNGPVALVIDGISASTTEVFAAGMQDIGRVRVFGQTSAGAALPALMTELPNGDVLLHAFADFIPPSGTSVEGRGVVPDEPVVLRRDDLLAGRDAQLQAALSWLQDSLRRQRQDEGN